MVTTLERFKNTFGAFLRSCVTSQRDEYAQGNETGRWWTTAVGQLVTVKTSTSGEWSRLSDHALHRRASRVFMVGSIRLGIDVVSNCAWVVRDVSSCGLEVTTGAACFDFVVAPVPICLQPSRSSWLTTLVVLHADSRSSFCATLTFV